MLPPTSPRKVLSYAVDRAKCICKYHAKSWYVLSNAKSWYNLLKYLFDLFFSNLIETGSRSYNEPYSSTQKGHLKLFFLLCRFCGANLNARNSTVAPVNLEKSWIHSFRRNSVLNPLDHVHIWQVEPLLRWGDSCQIWAWYLKGK